MRRSVRIALLILLAMLAGPLACIAQGLGGRLVLVLPFDNTSHEPNLDWISSSFPAVLNQRLTTAGYSAISREDRLYALDRLGLPSSLRPSHAMALRIAQEMDADYVVYGSYNADGKQIQINARVLDVRNLHLSNALFEQDVLTQLIRAENALCWDVIRTIDPHYSVDRTSFLAAAPALQLSAFENYVRGLLATSAAEKIRHFQAALAESPDDVAATYALGRAFFDDQQYEAAAKWFARVPSDHPLALQAAFYLGQSQFYSGQYAQAEQSFAFVAARLPLPEVVNNEGVAATRHGKVGIALFQQAVTADPKEEDYRYNLAVSLRRAKDVIGARREVQEALTLRPNDQEARELQNLLRTDSAGSSDDSVAPLERLKRDFNLTAFREAAAALEQVEQARLSTEPPQQRSQALSQNGEGYLAQGLTLEAEQAFQQALAADRQNWQAHAGLAAVRARTGNVNGAVAEAQSSINLKPNAQAYLALAAAQVALRNLPAAAAATKSALQLEPDNAAALQLKMNLTARGVAVQ